MGFECGFAIGAEDIDWLKDLVVDALDELLDWLQENLSFWSSERTVVACEVFYTLYSLRLLELAVKC